MESTKNVSPAVESATETQVPGIKALRDAIPDHCFERSLWRSLSYVARDLVALSLLFASAAWLTGLHSSWAVSVPLWTLYSFVQGLFFTGLWILAHECGHDSFSSNLRVNSIVGWFLHSILLVPFFSWKFSHSRHHRYANHMEKDTVFVPNRAPKAEPSLMERVVDHTAADTPIVSFFSLVIHQVFGWPAYILINAGAGVNSLTRSDRKSTSRWKQSHLDPTSSVFTVAEQPYVLMSNIGILSVLAVLYQVSKSFGAVNTFLMYGLPYLWMNHWIIAITYLHHTHPEAPHYEEGTWTYQKGAMSTVDREFGFIGRHIFHGIIEYHVVHHIFPRIPFYHCEEATFAIAPLLGDKYIQQKTSFFGDLWEAFTTCKYVSESPKGQPGALHWVKA